MIAGLRPVPISLNVKSSLNAGLGSTVDSIRRPDLHYPFRSTLKPLLDEIKRDVHRSSPSTLVERFQQRVCDLLEQTEHRSSIFSGDLLAYFNPSDSHCVALLEPLLRCSTTLTALCRAFLGTGGNCYVVQGDAFSGLTENGASCVTLALDVQGGWSEQSVNGVVVSGEQCAVSTLITMWLSHLIGIETDPVVVTAFLQLIEFDITPYGLSLALEEDTLDGLSFDAAVALHTKQQQQRRKNSAQHGQSDRVWLPNVKKSTLGLLLELVSHLNGLCRPPPHISPADPADYIALVRALFGAGSRSVESSEYSEYTEPPILLSAALGEPFQAVPFMPFFSISLAAGGCEFQAPEQFIFVDRNSSAQIKIHTAPSPLGLKDFCRNPLLLNFNEASALHNISALEGGTLHLATVIERNAFGNDKITVQFGDVQAADSDEQDYPPLWIQVKSDGARLTVHIGEGVFGSQKILFENKIDAGTSALTTASESDPRLLEKLKTIISQRTGISGRSTVPASVPASVPVPASDTSGAQENVYSRFGQYSFDLLVNMDHAFDRVVKGVGAALFSPFWVSSQLTDTEGGAGAKAIVHRKLFRASYLNTFYKLDSLPPATMHSMAPRAKRYAAILDEVLMTEMDDFNALREERDLLATEAILVMYANRIKPMQLQLAEHRRSKTAPSDVIEALEIKLATFRKRYADQYQLQGDMVVLLAAAQARRKLKPLASQQGLSLAQARVNAMRQYVANYGAPDRNITPDSSDHALFEMANYFYDASSPNYNRLTAKRLAGLEALNYYFPAKTKQLHLDIEDPDFIDRFISSHYAVFDVETVHRFYQKQFQQAVIVAIPAFRTRGQVGLMRYYGQLNDYVRDNLVAHASSIVQKISLGINALDLERPYLSVIGLDITYRDDGTPIRGGMPNIIKRPVTGDNRIYLIKADSGTIYATSTFGGAMVIEDASACIDANKFDALARRELAAKAVISIATLSALLWPDNSPLPTDKTLEIVAPRRYPLPHGDSPGSFLRSDQARLLRQYVAIYREHNMDRAWYEKLASWTPFFNVIQRSHYDPYYSPDFKELVFDSLDLIITLISIGIPVYKLGSVGLRATQGAIKAAHVAGITGAGLRKMIFHAAQPYLKKMALTTGKEVAAFIIPPIDWGRTLVGLGHKIVRQTGAIKPGAFKPGAFKPGIRPDAINGANNFPQGVRVNGGNKGRTKPRKNGGHIRCNRMVGAVCSQVSGTMANRYFSYTYSLARGRDAEQWKQTLLQLIQHPDTWKGGEAIVDRGFARRYKTEFNQKLSGEEQEAVRGWSFVDPQKLYGTALGNDLIQGYSNHNFFLNEALRGDRPLTRALATAAINLSSALRKLPAPHGKTLLVRVSDVDAGYPTNLALGDLVTNYPVFMSASGRGELLESAMSTGTLFGKGTALAIYHIEAKSAKPLIKHTSTQVPSESEWIFDPESFFILTGISKVRRLTNGVPYGKEIIVIGLKEVDKTPGISVAKNIHTGQSVSPKKLLLL